MAGRLAGTHPRTRREPGPSAATILALQQDRPGTPERPVTNNAGCHALIRTLPAAALATTRSRDQLKREAEACAALTHGAPAAQQATATAVLFAAECLSGRDPTDALSRTGQLAEGGQLDQVRDEAEHAPADRNRLARIAPDASAETALAGAVYCVLSHPGPGSEVTALQLASTAPHPAPVAAITGAILGAAHGVHAWPVELVSRLDLAWPLDTLARDLLRQLTNDPEVSDPGWWDRYPGW
nr:ADP-ribosylglycohydrolase family protein [Raineyella fluvialis]